MVRIVYGTKSLVRGRRPTNIQTCPTKTSAVSIRALHLFNISCLFNIQLNPSTIVWMYLSVFQRGAVFRDTLHGASWLLGRIGSGAN